MLEILLVTRYACLNAVNNINCHSFIDLMLEYLKLISILAYP